MSRSNAALATLFIAAHLAIGVIHSLAHEGLGVGLTSFQQVFVDGVYVGLPVLAAVLVWSPLYRAGVAVLLASIAASLVFGGWYHFLFVSPDHVAHLPQGGRRLLFQVTAVLMTLVDAAGVWLAAMLLRAPGVSPPASVA